jgi:hypothetical protein
MRRRGLEAAIGPTLLIDRSFIQNASSWRSKSLGGIGALVPGVAALLTRKSRRPK